MKRIKYVEAGHNKDGPDKRLDEDRQAKGDESRILIDIWYMR